MGGKDKGGIFTLLGRIGTDVSSLIIDGWKAGQNSYFSWSFGQLRHFAKDFGQDFYKIRYLQCLWFILRLF